jgi:hemolysin activation/secretion protein
LKSPLLNHHLVKHAWFRLSIIFYLTFVQLLAPSPTWAQPASENAAESDSPPPSDTSTEEKNSSSDNSLPEISLGEDALSALNEIPVKKFKFVFAGEEKGDEKDKKDDGKDKKDDGKDHVFSSQELEKLANQYWSEKYKKNSTLTPEQLQEIKNFITEQYVKEGYLNSGAIIPDQQVKDGVIEIKIIEGKLVRVEVTGVEWLRESYIRKRLENRPGQTLNVNHLQDKLQLLQQNPLVKRLHAELGPGIQLGEGLLKIDIEEDIPYQVQFNFNNYRAPSVGAYRGEIVGQHRNLTRFGDTVYARYGLTEGLKDFTFKYSLPFNRYDTSLLFQLERSDSDVIERPFSELDVESEATTYWVGLGHPLWKTPTSSLDLTLQFEKRHSKTFLLGHPFSFSPGVENGETKLSIIRFSQQWLDRSRIHVYAARSVFSLGIDALDATINDDGSPDSKFFTWLGQFQVVRRLDWFEKKWLKESQFLFKTNFQLADDELLPLEKLSLGGLMTVRGYRENLVTRDNGVTASVEWQIPIPKKFPIPRLSKNKEDGLLELTPFIDYGYSWNANDDTPTAGPKDLYSIGLGIHWYPTSYLRAELFLAHGLRDIEEPEEDDLQDQGVHFGLTLEIPF